MRRHLNVMVNNSNISNIKTDARLFIVIYGTFFVYIQIRLLSILGIDNLYFRNISLAGVDQNDHM